MTKTYGKIVEILSTKTDYVKAISDVAGESKVSTVTMALKQMGDDPTKNQIIDVLDKFSKSDWDKLIANLDLTGNATLTSYVDQFHNMNQFLFGLNIADAPGWKLSIALVVPIVSALMPRSWIPYHASLLL